MSNNVLAVSVSLKHFSVALKHHDGIYCRNEKADSSKYLISVVQDTLNEHGMQLTDIDAMAVSSGPGSFTGIRVGLSMAKALKVSIQLPIYSLSYFDVMWARAKNDVEDMRTLFLISEENSDGIYCQIRRGDFVEETFFLRSGDIPLSSEFDAIVHEDCIQSDDIAAPKVLSCSSFRDASAILECLDSGLFAESIQILPCYIKLPYTKMV